MRRCPVAQGGRFFAGRFALWVQHRAPAMRWRRRSWFHNPLFTRSAQYFSCTLQTKASVDCACGCLRGSLCNPQPCDADSRSRPCSHRSRVAEGGTRSRPIPIHARRAFMLVPVGVCKPPGWRIQTCACHECTVHNAVVPGCTAVPQPRPCGT